MSIFNIGAKKAAENYVYESLSKLDILDDLLSTILDNTEDWINNCQSYYDNRKREVTIGEDLFQIRWVQYEYEQEKRVEKTKGEVNYSFTLSGYTPLHNHINDKGKELVSVSKVIYLWTSIICEHLQKNMPECEFSNVTQFEDHSSFSYTVPPLTWKRWF